MKKILLLILLPATLIQSTHSQEMITEKLDSAVAVYASLNAFNGSVLVARHGKVLLQKGYGYKNVQDKSVNDANTIFQVGSITKEFTATIILKLIEQKKLALTEKLSKYYAGLPGGDSITIKNLLTHTSGIFNYTEINNFWNQLSLPTNEKNVTDSLRNHVLLFLPGEKFSYSNSNYMLLAYIIQKITGQSYETVVRNWIFKPLNMTHSGFDFTGLKNPDKSTGYWDFSAAKYTVGPPSDSSEYIGGGEIYSTVNDLYRWHQALQSGNILSKALQEQAYQPFKGPYGYGWELDTIYDKKIVGHAGRMFGFESKMIRIPEDDIFIILLNNESAGPALQLVANKVLAILYQRPYTLPEQPLQLSEEQLKIYAGTYLADGDHTFEVALINGHLFGIEGPDRLHEFFPMKNNNFKVMDHNEEAGIFEFIMDENGQVKEVTTVNPRGIRVTLKKVK